MNTDRRARILSKRYQPNRAAHLRTKRQRARRLMLAASCMAQFNAGPAVVERVSVRTKRAAKKAAKLAGLRRRLELQAETQRVLEKERKKAGK